MFSVCFLLVIVFYKMFQSSVLTNANEVECNLINNSINNATQYKRPKNEIIDQLLRNSITSHITYHQQTATTDYAILQDILRIVTERKIQEVFANKTNKYTQFEVGEPYIVKPFYEDETGTLRATSTSQCRFRGKAYMCTIYIPWTQRKYSKSNNNGNAEANNELSNELQNNYYNNRRNWGKPYSITTYTTSISIPIAVGSFICHIADAHPAAILDECPYDLGGYFIVKGCEKIIVCPILPKNNFPYIYCVDHDTGQWTLQYRSLSDHKKRSTSTLDIYLSAKRTVTSNPGIKVTVPFITTSIPISMVLRLLGVDSNTDAMMTAILGENYQQNSTLSDDAKNLLELCFRDEYVHMSMETILLRLSRYNSNSIDGSSIKDDVAVGFNKSESNLSSSDIAAAAVASAAAAAFVASQQEHRSRAVLKNFTNEFLPNMGLQHTTSNLARKEKMFGLLVHQLLCAYDKGPSAAVDRDDCRNRRVEHTGCEITYLFRRGWRPIMKSMLGACHKMMNDCTKKMTLVELTKMTQLQSLLIYGFSTGNWGTEKAGSTQTGVSQQRTTLNYAASIAHMDRVTSQRKKAGKDPKPRLLHSSQWGVYCPVQSPEGESCGQTHNLTASGYIRIGMNAEYIRSIVIDGNSNDYDLTECNNNLTENDNESINIIDDCSRDSLRQKVKFILNGAIEGTVENPEKKLRQLRKLRQYCAIPFSTSIYYDNQTRTLNVATDSGSAMRPVFILGAATKSTNNDNISKLSETIRQCRRYPYLLTRRLMCNGIMQYIDKDEETTALIANSWQQLEQQYNETLKNRNKHPDSNIKVNNYGSDKNKCGSDVNNCGSDKNKCGSDVNNYGSDKNKCGSDKNKYGSRSNNCGSENNYGSDKQFTHAEIHPTLILGLCSGRIPFCDKNQAPRNIYGTCMEMQSMASGNLVQNARVDTVAFELWYPQKRICNTQVGAATNANDLPTGQNSIVAILPQNGKNMEDAVELSQSSLDMGMFRTFYERTHREEDGGIGSQKPKFEQISESRYDELGRPIINYRDGNYGILGEDGLAEVGTIVKKNDCICGKRERVAGGGVKDSSLCYKGREDAQISAVYCVCMEGSGRKQVFIKTKVHRRPQRGDKFSNPHGQKGVCGDIIRREDLPYTSTGITPDIIINPHGQPSRMTTGQQIEGVVSKLLSALPVGTAQADATAFINDMRCRDGMIELDKMDAILAALGYGVMGSEQLYSGITGLPLGEATLYRFDNNFDKSNEQSNRGKINNTTFNMRNNCATMTPLYYQALRHIACEKVGARQRGAYEPITLQPVEGRSRNGGLRFGEMEKDALSSYGASELLRGRLFKDSDPFPVVQCQRCNLEAQHRGPSKMYCPRCDSYETCVQTYLPRGFHCAMQESQSMLIGWRLHMGSNQ